MPIPLVPMEFQIYFGAEPYSWVWELEMNLVSLLDTRTIGGYRIVDQQDRIALATYSSPSDTVAATELTRKCRRFKYPSVRSPI